MNFGWIGAQLSPREKVNCTNTAQPLIGLSKLQDEDCGAFASWVRIEKWLVVFFVQNNLPVCVQFNQSANTLSTGI